MNEQRESENLDAFIARQLAGGKRDTPAGDAEVMAAHIIRLTSAAKPDPNFIAQLEKRLEQEEKQMSKRVYLKYVAAVAVVMAFSVVAVTFRTELRAFAQEVINLFLPAESDERTIEAEFGGVSGEIPSGDAEIAATVPASVRYPAFVPEAYALSLETYDEEAGSVLRYTCASNPNWAFSLWQYDTASYQVEIGESAEIEMVTLDNDAEAQYVRGEWRVSEPPVIGETTAAGSTITLTQVWEDQSAVQHLTWQADGYHYYLSISGTDSPASLPSECAIDEETFIAIANSIE